MESKGPEEKFVIHKLLHCEQRYSWDCGMACIAMLLPQDDRKYLQDNLLSICEEEGFNKSIWSIDLCYVLLKFNIPHVMFTITLGVNEEFREEGYYSANLSEDRGRVISRFAKASSHDIRVLESSLSISKILRQLLDGPIIMLVDASLLVCSLCKYNKLALELRSCLPMSRQYMGHYIVVVGFNLNKEKFLYRNPSFHDRLCAISFHDLQRARTSFGTDQDTIFVHKSYR